ncbi:MAG: hypothetical protein A2408_00630 [Candidatus Yonathbacteria bacterium RIFOXYC1_FULL_52_10]|nr:MAG: hypothetical protein A2408_00630 [Candidatus Yonathbacteria bacterium RIFOXYC1_FULL_52_10]
MIVNAEVKKTGNESPVTLIKRFSRRMQSTGIIPRLKSERYFERTMSKYKVKARALKTLERRKVYDRLKKLGKLPAQPARRGR